MDPLAIALREIAETKSLLQSLLKSSENFDYPKAKLALRELTKKVQALSKAKAKFETLLKQREPNIRLVDFRGESVSSAKKG